MSRDLLAELGRRPGPVDVSSIAPGADAERALTQIRMLCDAFEAQACARTTGELLELEAVLAEALGRDDEAAFARARSGYLAATHEYIEGDTSRAAELMRAVAADYGRLGNDVRRFHAETLAIRYELAATLDHPDSALEQAVAALDGIPTGTEAEAALEHARRLATDIAAAPVRETSTRFFAKCATIAADNDAGPVELSMLVRLGGALVALGLAEFGLELLDDAGGRLQGFGTMGPDGQPQPLPESLDGDYWAARAYQRIGRVDDAERAYVAHRARAGDGARGAESATRLAELIAEQGRVQEALDILEPLSTQDLPPEYLALVHAMSARLADQLGRHAVAAQRATDAEVALESSLVAGDRSMPDEAELEAALRRGDIKQRVATLVADRMRGGSPEPGLHGMAAAATVRARLELGEHALAAPGRDDEAERHVALAAATLDVLGGDARTSRAHRLRASLHAHRGEHRAAVDLLEAALAVELDVPPLDLPSILDRRVPADAVRVEMRSTREGRGLGVALRCRLAVEYVAAGLADEARLDAAIAAAGERNLLGAHCDALVAKSTWAMAQGRPEDAVHCLDTAIDVIEGMRWRLADTELQVTALADRETVYESLLQAAQAAGAGPDEQLATIERAKGRALLNALPGDDAPAPDAARLLLAARRERHDLLQELRRRFAEHDADEARLEAARGRLSAAFRTVHSPRGAAARAAASVERLGELGSGGTVLLHYFRVGDGFVVGVVADGSVRRVAKLPGAAPAKVADLLEAFAFERDVLGPTRSLRELARLLVDPLEHDLEAAERLLVIPHDVLHAVPFHALMDPSGRPLLERMPISYAPSGAIALHARDRLGRADPATGSLGFAVDVLPYIALPRIGAAEELAAVADTVPGLESYAGRAAVRRQLLTRAGTFEVLHLACHGEFDPADALLSRLYLADGPVYGYELLASAARARLVVLSACDSGVQGRYPGDELYGLVRAFVASGAIGVVSTLWAVPDDSSGELMKAFYGSWREGRLAPADALRVAQLDLYRSEAHRHPRYWAPYLLIGS